MKKIFLLLCLSAIVASLHAQVTVAGATGGSGSYTTLSDAFSGISASAGDNITITISGNTTEPATGATLNAGAWATLTIAPSGGPWTISGAATAGNPLINFNGADNVTVNGGGNLIFSNTTVSATTGTSTLKLVADATNNTFNNVTFLGAGTGAAGTNASVVWISTGTTTGNDNNQFQSCKFGPVGSSLPGQYIVANGSTTSKAIQNSNVIINNCEFKDYFLASGTQAAIYVSSGNTEWTITNNKIYQTASRTITAASTVYGIYCSNTGATATGESFFISNNTIGFANNAGTGTTIYNAGSTGGGFTGISFNASSSVASTHNINNNIISNIEWTSSSSSAFNGISSTSVASSTSGFILNQNANQIKNINWINASGQITCINSGYSPATSVSNNVIDNITRSGSGIFYGIQYTGNTSSSHTFHNNTISNLNFNHVTGTSAFYGIYSASAPAVEIFTSNTISGLISMSTGSQNIYGIYNLTATTGNKTCKNNTVNNLTLPSSSAGSIYGLRIAYLGATNDVSGNTVYGLSGGANVYGMLVGSSFAANAITNVYQNKIYNLTTDKSTGKTVGLTAGTGISSQTNIYNNLIGELNALSASAATDAIRGIELTGTSATSNYNLYYNSIYLDGTASSGADFASSAVYHTYSATGTSASLTMQNNNFINKYLSKGVGVSAVFKRSASTDLNNYNTASNNNNFYGTNIYHDGTNTDAGIASFKARVTTRESSSVSENATFLSTAGGNANFLKPNPAVGTQLESGGTNVSSITTDFALTVRQGNLGYSGTGTAPDIGAWEFEGIAVDLTPPTITFTPLPNSTAGASQTLVASITDASGVPTSGIGLPVLYYSINGGAYTAVTASYSGGSYNFIFAPATAGGDTVRYYVVAQDMAPAPNIGSNASAGASGFTANPPAASTPPSAPAYYRILKPFSGTVTVGATGDYPTLTAPGGLFEALNANFLSGNLQVQITSDITTETGAFGLNQWAESGAGGYSLKIYPTGAPHTVSGSRSSGALIQLVGADRVTIDGSLSGTGTDRSLTITNTATTAPTAISLVSLGAGAGATNNVVKNLKISTGVATSIGYGIAIGGATPGSDGADNDNVTISNNEISGAPTGIRAFANATGLNDNLMVSGNTITYSGSAESMGIQLAYAVNGKVNNNTVSIESSYGTATGISIQLHFSSGTVQGNVIKKVVSTNTGGYGGRGITIGTALSASNLTVANNIIYGVNGSDYNSFGNSSSMGLVIGVIGNSTTLTTVAGGLKIYHNSIRMTGAIGSYSTSGITTAVYVGSGASDLDIRNNIFASTQTGSETQKNYAVYSAVANTAFSQMNNNVYYVSGTQGVLGYIGSTARNTLSEFKTGFGSNANSFATDPQFVSATDLHINAGVTATPLESGGATVGITTDMDGDARPGPAGSGNGGGTAPDIGADEFDGVPLAPCTTPTAQPTALILNATGQTTASGSFTDASPSASGYLVIRTTSSTLAALPIDDTSYATGANTYFGTGGFVQSVGSATTFNATGLSSGTTYYFWVFSYNSGTCLGGPKYLTATPLSGNTTTGALFTSVATGNWEDGSTWDKGTAPTSGDDVVIAATHTVTVNGAAANASSLAINANGILTVSGNTLTINGVNAGGLTNNGTITANGGTVILGAGANNRKFTNAGVLNLSGTAQIIINGSFYMSAGAFNQDGGEMIIDGNDNNNPLTSVASGTDIFGIIGGVPNCSGGIITIVDPHVNTYSTGSGTNRTVRIGITAGTNYFTGSHTFILGDGISTTPGNSDGFVVETYTSGYAPIQNLTINGGNVAGRWGSGSNNNSTIYGCHIKGNLTINANSEMRQSYATGLFAVGGNIVNNGTLRVIGSTTTSALTLGTNSAFTVSNPQTVSGSGVFYNSLTAPTANFTYLTVNNTAGVTFGAGINNPSFSGTVTVTNGTVNASGISMNGSASSVALTAATSIINVQTFTNNSSAATVTLSGSGKLNVTDVVSFGNVNSKTLAAGGRLTLKSSASGTARLGDFTNGGANTGNKITGTVNVERYFPGGKRAYRFIGHPFTTAIRLDQLMTTSGANTGMDITGPGGSANGFTTTISNNASAYNYTTATGDVMIPVDPGWNAFPNANTANWNAKQGIRVLVRGTKGEGLDGQPYTPSATTVTMSGAVNDGNTPSFSLTTGPASDFNFIANPLASQIDMRNLTLGGDVNPNFYVWDVSGGTKGAYFNEPFSLASTYRVMPLGSAFFARSSSTGTISFPESAKTHNAPSDVFKGSSNYGSNSIQLSVYDNVGHKHDRMLFFVNANASSSKDFFDGEKLTNPGLNFYSSSSDNKKLSIDNRPFAHDSIIPLKLQNPDGDGNFVIAADDYNLSDDLDILLHDKKLNSYVQLSSGTMYPFVIAVADSSTYESRFELVMKSASVLPMQSIVISASQKTEGIEVRWTTENEADVQTHTVEKSMDGKSFEERISLTAKNQKLNSYSWMDMQAAAGDHYYRIKTKDKSGLIRYSTVAKVSISNKGEIVVYPNPVKNNLAQLRFTGMEKGSYTLKLYNTAGQEVFSRMVEHNGSTAIQTIQLSGVAAGVYNLHVNGKQTNLITKLVIE